MFSFLLLHIPDGFLSLSVSGCGWLVAGAVLAWAVRRTSTRLGAAAVPLVGVLGAFIFAAQAVNFPILGGTSGHLLGAALAAILLGPWSAVMVMTAVVIVQAVFFQDGGLLAMGCNLLNMAVLAVFSAHVVYRVLGRLSPRRWWAAVVAGWLSVVVGAAATGVELVWSGMFPASLAMPALLGVYGLVGIAEGLLTASAVGFLERSRPALLEETPLVEQDTAASLLTAGMTATLAAILLAPLASEAPDGLEHLAEHAGLAGTEIVPWFEVFPDYVMGFLGGTPISVVAAVAVGAVAVFALTSLVIRSLRGDDTV
jgi:cobalt/nickel transport system permease protein